MSCLCIDKTISKGNRFVITILSKKKTETPLFIFYFSVFLSLFFDFFYKVVGNIECHKLILTKLFVIFYHWSTDCKENVRELAMRQRKRSHSCLEAHSWLLLNNLLEFNFFAPEFLIVIIKFARSYLKGISCELHQGLSRHIKRHTLDEWLNFSALGVKMMDMRVIVSWELIFFIFFLEFQKRRTRSAPCVNVFVFLIWDAIKLSSKSQM